MALLYTTTKHLHLAVVGLSVSLFALRGLGALAGRAWVMNTQVRRISMAMDTLLLGLGLSLWWQLGVSLAETPWLATKLALLVAYVVLGSLALKRAPTLRTKALCLVLALAVVGQMAAVALTKQPLGFWAAPFNPTATG